MKGIKGCMEIKLDVNTFENPEVDAQDRLE